MPLEKCVLCGTSTKYWLMPNNLPIHESCVNDLITKNIKK
jgi:hypothetical protein